ncbi:MAG: hypothetical protein KGN02_09055 [bacterium]|nr:hypothetical protein [bacterium]
MLRAVFIGHRNRLNAVIAGWLARECDLVECVWIDPSTRWHQSWNGRWRFIKRRLRKRGALKTLDEIAYFLFHHATDRNSRNTRASYALVDEAERSLALAEVPCGIVTASVNDAAVLARLEALAPDVIFAHCLNEYFGQRLRRCARTGIFMWHVGITPEYRGLYSPFWTLYNGDVENFGYSLIHVNDDLDAGAVYVQGRISDVDVRHDNHVLIEHRAILASLPAVGRFLRALEDGSARAIERPDAREGYYSYPGLTDYLAQRWRVSRLARRGNFV